jgi:hypothetical protein
MKAVVLASVAVLALLGATTGARGAASCETCVDPLVALADLHATVDELVPERGLANSLDAKVEAATAAVTRGHYTPALNQMDAFENELDAATASGRVYTAISNIMKTKHDTVKNSISNVR